MSAPPRFPTQLGPLRTARLAAVWIFGVAGLLAYNWWVLVPLKPGLMRSPSELFSNLEVTGQCSPSTGRAASRGSPPGSTGTQ